MRNILFIGPCFKFEGINDGQLQRIKAVDDLFSHESRTYLRLSYKKYIIPQFRKDERNKIYYCRANIITCWPLIIYYLLKARVIYAHTIYNLSRILMFSLFIGKKKVVLDIHGVVPEEQQMMGNDKLAKKYNAIERKCFKRLAVAIHVTEAMQHHYKKKYPFYKGQHVIYGICPSNLKPDTSKDHGEELRETLHIGKHDIVIIYSGGMHAWQNIDEMLSLIKDNQHPNFKYIILSGEKDAFMAKIAGYDIDVSKIIVDCVTPAELSKYYAIANYGFVLRDNDIVNKVACPTKLIEYLFYGIIPIVKSPEIGDFLQYGYEYVAGEQMNISLICTKSETNSKIARELLHVYNNSGWTKLI